MKMIRNTFLLGVLVAVPAIGMAQTAPAKPAPAPAAKSTAAPKTTVAKAPAAHATKGVVKSVDATSLVITGAKNAEMTFVLNAATTKTGTPVVGSNVQVRYKTEAKQNIATAVTVAAAKT